ncbi:uncharacterized protein LOC101900908 isoform X4 [Musca domestica]|uniref:Uncharacterized protein LOC101900908 isoform X4 n=1 Tax=Musca domestica TaxID=7370 RepID=A0ABM3VGX1_MUSDO|nr:uncharacterized protein LOC101900908 isoform X4 [Musca domestica]
MDKKPTLGEQRVGTNFQQNRPQQQLEFLSSSSPSLACKPESISNSPSPRSTRRRHRLQRSTDNFDSDDAENFLNSRPGPQQVSGVMGGGFVTPPTAAYTRDYIDNAVTTVAVLTNNESTKPGSAHPSSEQPPATTKQMHEKLLENDGCDKTPPSSKGDKGKAHKPHKESKFAEKLRRSFRRAEHKSLEIKRQDKLDAERCGGLRPLHQQLQNSASIFSLTNLPGLGGHINPALLLDSPDESTPPEFAYRHLSSVATTNSSTSLESNFCESPTTSISYWAWHMNNNNMGGEVSTANSNPNSNQANRNLTAPSQTEVGASGTGNRANRRLEQQSSSKSEQGGGGGGGADHPSVTADSRSCSTASESSTAAKLTRLQNFLFKSSNESSRSIQGHSNEGFTISSFNSSSGEWENLCNFPSTSQSVAHNEDTGQFPLAMEPEEASRNKKENLSDSNGSLRNYYQYTLASPSNPFLPEITARTYHSTYEEEEEDRELEEELDSNVTSVKYRIGCHSAQLPTPNYSRTGSQESTHSDYAGGAYGGLSGSNRYDSSNSSLATTSTPGKHKRKLFSLSTPTKLDFPHNTTQPAITSSSQTSSQHSNASKTTSSSSSCNLVRSLNPFLPSTTVTSSSPPQRTSSSSSLNKQQRMGPFKQQAVTSPIAIPTATGQHQSYFYHHSNSPQQQMSGSGPLRDLNARREEFLKATMQICLVVSPPSSRLQLKSKSLTHLDGLQSELVSNTVSSSEYFLVSFCNESGCQDEFFPAAKGVTLANALSQALRKRNLSFSQLTITDSYDNNQTSAFLGAGSSPLQISLDENTEVENLAGHHLFVSDKDSSKKTLQKAASFGSRARPPRLLSSASTDESSEVNITGKQPKQRWSGLFGVKNPQQSQLCELLNSYSKNGVPQRTPATLNFDHPDLDNAIEYLDKMHKSWTDFVECSSMNDVEMRIQTAIWELVTTEVDYIHCLQTVTDLFLACLESVQEEGLLKEVDQHRLFANIRDICEANLKFWTLYLYPMVAHSIQTREPLRIGFFQPGFIAFANLFAPYKKYCAEQSTCQFYCKELNRTNSLFTSYLAWCEAQKMCNRLRLADILVRPMQRLTKYSLLLTAIKKHMTDIEEIEALETMIQTTEHFVCSVNNHLTTRQENERLKGVMARIESYDVVDTNNEHLEKMIKQHSQMFDLCAPMKGCASQHVRHLFMEGDHKYKDNLGKADVHCFLLTDMLLVCKSIAKKGLGTLKVIRQPYLTDRLIVQHSNNILSCVYVNEFQVAVNAFTLQCSEAQKWYEALKRARTIYTRMKQSSISTATNWEAMRFGGSMISAGTVDSLGVKKSPLNSSICSHVTSANNSHSGSVEWNDSRNISVEFDKTNSLSSDEGCAYLGAHGFPLKGKPVTTISPQKLKVNTSSSNTLTVQPLNHLGQSLPDLNLHHSHTNLYHTYSNNTLLVPGAANTSSTQSGNLLLSPSHRGISYPPPSPTRVPLRRGMAFSNSIKYPPLEKTRKLTSQNSINWHQIPATPTPTSPQSQHTSPSRQALAPNTPDNVSVTSNSSSNLAVNTLTESEAASGGSQQQLQQQQSNPIILSTQLSNSTETDV